MKPICFLFALLSISFTGRAQAKGSVTLYGYYQTVSRGRAPEIDPETGLRTSRGQGRNYFLYAVSPSRIYPVEIWIEGTRMGVTAKTIPQTRVEYHDNTNPGSAKKILVPQTTERIMQLILAPASEGKHVSTKAQNLARSNDVVLVYKEGGKFYYSTLPALTALSSVAAQ